MCQIIVHNVYRPFVVCVVQCVQHQLHLLLSEERWFEINSQLATNITELHLMKISAECIELVEYISTHFVLMRHLSLQAIVYHDHETGFIEEFFELEYDLLRAISQLKQLTELKLDKFAIHMESLDDQKAQMDIPRIASVKQLHLLNQWAVTGILDGEFFCRLLSTAFPNLEELTIRTIPSIFRLALIEPHVQYFTHLRHCRLFDPHFTNDSICFDRETFGHHKQWFEKYLEENLDAFD